VDAIGASICDTLAVTADDSLNPDLTGSVCSVGNCFAVADIVATATVRLPAEVGVVEADESMVLETPVCMDHAHLLRMGVTSFDFESFPGGA
jgi:hypothetical protein